MIMNNTIWKNPVTRMRIFTLISKDSRSRRSILNYNNSNNMHLATHPTQALLPGCSGVLLEQRDLMLG